MKHSYLILAFTILTDLCSSAAPPNVTTSCFTAIGSWDSNIPQLAYFRGIPFAQPPVGELRWQPSTKYPCTHETFQATKNGPYCYQNSNNDPNQSEDCLNLNIYTRSIGSSTLFPTVVWFYGGGNVDGSSTSYGDLEKWSINDNVCVVAFNYRLNIFGYLALKELSGTDSRKVSGNYGITDTITVLNWVQENIKFFGCDPNNVTIFGQSSGGTNILALLATPSAKGLFHKAISLSGSPNITKNLATAENQNAPLVSVLNCNKSTDVAACLRAVPANLLLNAVPDNWYSSDFWPTNPNGLSNDGLVIVDGITIVTDLLSAVSIPIIDIPIFISSMRDEDELWASNDPPTKLNINDYNTFLHNNFLPWSNTTGDQLATYYMPVTSVSVPQSYFDLNSDLGIFCGNIELGINAGKKFKNPVYVGVVMQPPGKPYASMIYPFHIWDYITATGAFNWFDPSYTPTSSDLSLGLTLQKEYYSIMKSGQSVTLKSINNTTGFPNNYLLNVVGDASFSSVVVPQVNYRQDICQLLKTLRLDIDSRFWWIN